MSTLGHRPASPAHLHLKARGSWISLFAMLMIFIGPLISQAMPMDHAASMAMSPSMVMEEPGCHGEAADAAHHEAPAEHHVLWEKCGYCSLLFNCPALPQSLFSATFAAPPPHAFITAEPRQGHARQAVFPGARSRAPPSFS